MPGPLVTNSDIANGAITSQPRKFSANKSSMRSARMFFYFATANVPVAMPHSLRKTPSSWKLVSVSRDGSPGTVYAPTRYDTTGASTKSADVYSLGRNYMVLACTTANTWCEVEIT